MKKSLLLATTAALAFSPLAVQADTGFLVGASVARDQSNADDFFEDAVNNVADADSADAEMGGDVYVGLAANEIFTFRFGYRKFGDAEADVLGGIGKFEVETDGFYVAADAMFPLTPSFYVGGTLGIQDADITFRVRGPGGSDSMDDDARDFFYGLRAAWLLSEQAGVTASYSRYAFEADDVSEDLEYDSLAVGLEYRF
ncbi:MAG: outer membrane beta-barrel protein [Alcanivorax sp.]|uniref:Porin family protein n=1 Tax=Alloalcanivorax marinus TaxID=1177169 RepID=A0A9Q3YNM5_9GAMM|nr:outer membrane beta-barrel protein [Alloalcanivorax marinus]MBM7334550.1 outer membrane beta-barrel protein [Alloalcanivorax marinus]MCC4310004.1 porin family protein [Alloalcanivorax marinus]